MNLPIKHQLSQIVSQLSYKAFGFNFKMDHSQVQFITNHSSSQKIAFKIPIPQLIYKEYSKDGFIYSDPGITPKQIADDILVHFKELNHVQMESDQFGNIKATLKDQYFDDKYEQMLKYNDFKCLECNQIKFHDKQSVKSICDIETKDPKNLFVLFLRNQQSITLSQLRQKFVFQVLRKISSRYFLTKAQSFNHFDEKCSIKTQIPASWLSNYTKIYFGSLKHQIINKERRLENLFGTQKVREMTEKFYPLKFGLVVPENICLKYADHGLSKQQVLKLKKIFYGNALQRPINFSKIATTDCQFKNTIEKKNMELPGNLSQLLFTTEQMLLNFEVTEIYHRYLLLCHFFESEKSKNGLPYPSSCQKKKYKNTAKVIKEYLQEILFKHESEI